MDDAILPSSASLDDISFIFVGILPGDPSNERHMKQTFADPQDRLPTRNMPLGRQCIGRRFPTAFVSGYLSCSHYLRHRKRGYGRVQHLLWCSLSRILRPAVWMQCEVGQPHM
jgi:hypothetical protein